MNKVTIGYFPENLKLVEGNSDNSRCILFLEELFKSPRCELVRYKGISRCRCCEKANGSGEYGVILNEVKYVIPEGYLHYLREHKIAVDPSLIKLMNLWSKQ